MRAADDRTWLRPLGWIVVAVVAADWATKLLITNRLPLHGRLPLLDGWVYAARLRNAGVSFSLLGGAHGGWRTPLLVAITGTAIVGLARWALTVREPAARRALALVIAGAIGNLGDRLANGGVTDFLVVRYFPWVFNLADLAITTGALLLAWQLLPGRGRAGPPRAS